MTPVTWKAGKQPIVSMSVCEAELLEGSNCALLVQSTEAMLREILPATGTPTLYIDNQAASNLLNGSSGSWRTRHLRIRHAYVMDRVRNGELHVQHLAGEDQPGDLPTKLHSKARLLHLLGTWGMIGLAGLDEKKVLQCMKLGCMFLLLLAVQSLAKEPLPTVATMELFVLLILTCISAVALWEAGKAFGGWAYPRLFGSKRERKMRKLRGSQRRLRSRSGWMKTMFLQASGCFKPRDKGPLPRLRAGSPTTESSPRNHEQAYGPDEHGGVEGEHVW